MPHTKGNWTIGEDGDVFCDDTICIATVVDFNKANARLIAAAPLMLKMCRESLLKWDEYVNNSGDNNSELMNFIGDLRETIFKATAK